MTAATFSPTDAHGLDPARAEADPDAERRARIRGFVGRWVRGEEIASIGGGGMGRTPGHPDRGMNGAAGEADLWRHTARLTPPLPSVVIVSRLVTWEASDRVVQVRRPDGSPVTTPGHLGNEVPVVRTTTDWRVEGGWPSVVSPYLCALLPRHQAQQVVEAQRVIRRTWNHIGFFQDAVRQAQREIADRLPPGWLDT